MLTIFQEKSNYFIKKIQQRSLPYSECAYSRGRDEMVARFGDVQNGKQAGRLAGRSAQRAHAALHSCYFFLHTGHGGV